MYLAIMMLERARAAINATYRHVSQAMAMAMAARVPDITSLMAYVHLEL